MQADEFQTLACHDVAQLAPLSRAQCERIFAEREGGQFNSRITSLAHHAALLRKRTLIERLIAHGIAKGIGHWSYYGRAIHAAAASMTASRPATGSTSTSGVTPLPSSTRPPA